MACGRHHTVFATENGELFSCGAGGDGQLGHGNTEDLHEPKKIVFKKVCLSLLSDDHTADYEYVYVYVCI